jgi:hypothetical protein
MNKRILEKQRSKGIRTKNGFFATDRAFQKSTYLIFIGYQLYQELRHCLLAVMLKQNNDAKGPIQSTKALL